MVRVVFHFSGLLRSPVGRFAWMMGMLLMVPSLPLFAQEDDRLWGEVMEQWAEQNDSEEVPDDLLEQLQGYIDAPINLNDTASDALHNLPFLTDLQCDIIKAYIAQNGEMVSLAELHLLNGFDSLTLSLLRPFVTVAPVAPAGRTTLREMLLNGRSNLRMGGKVSWPLSRGYREDSYAGSPFRAYFRYQFKCADRIVFQLSGDKDPGESFLHQSPVPGFDYYGYYLMMNDFGIVKKAIVGKYQLQFGQGATLWSGTAPWMSGSMPLWRYGQGIKPASAFCEYGYLRGAATTLALHRRWEMTLFYSHANRDATTTLVADSLDGEEAVIQSLYQSGYHRTQTEIDKKGQLTEQLLGGHLQYRSDRLVVGTTAFATVLSEAIVPHQYAYNAFAFRGNRNLNLGVDATYRYRRLLLFGEMAVACNDSLKDYWSEWNRLPVAAVAGMQLHFDAGNRLSLAYHYGSPTYQNLHSNTLGQSASPQNEEGLLLFFQTRLPFNISFQSSVDWFRFPWMRYRIYSPSSGVDYRMALSKEVANHTRFSCQFRYKSAQRNSDGSLYSVERTHRSQLHLSLDYTPDESLRLLSRVIYSWFGCEEHASQQGMVICQDVAYKWSRAKRPCSLTARLALFDISAYDARIYMYENDLMYEFAVPMLMDRGMRCYLLFRQELSSNLSLALKYGFTLYPERESIGSGYDRVDANHRHELKIQMRWRF